MSLVDHAASRRKKIHTRSDRTDLNVPSICEPVDQAMLTRGGRLIWLRTRRCPATCNVLAALAGIGDMAEVF